MLLGQTICCLQPDFQKKEMSKDMEMDLTTGNGIISSFTSSMLQQPHVVQVVEVLTGVARMLLAILE